MSSDSSSDLNFSQADALPTGKFVYQFREFTLDPDACTLARGDDLLPLPSKVFELLLLLVRNHDRVVTKQEIFDQVWAGSSVEESNLTQSIFVLRKTLRHSAQNRFVATFPGKGYRFVAPVEVQDQTEHLPEPARASVTPWKLVALALVALVAIALTWVGNRRQNEALKGFWGPILSNSQPAVICFSSTPTFDLGFDFRRRFVRADPEAKEWFGAEVLPIPAAEVVKGDQIVPVVNQFVGIGSAYAMAEVSRVFAAAGKPSVIEMATQTTFGTIRAHPVVLIGGFNNPWTLQLAKDARFIFDSDENRRRQIKDRQTGKVYYFPPGGTPYAPIEDFAIVSRVLDRSTGEPLVVIAGITQYGTRAAGEFVGSNDLLREASETAPVEWRHKNFQFLLRAKVVKGVPARPTVVAVHVW